MMVFKDQLEREITLPQYARRIISLVPSQTELLYDLGLSDEVIGITKFCIHPAKWHATKTKVGGTKNVNIALVQALQPDLIIANKEENSKEQIEQLEKVAPVWISDINTLPDALQMINEIGRITNRLLGAENISRQISDQFNTLSTTNSTPRICYLIWYHPYMTVGKNTFINEMLSLCGFINVFENKSRYPEVDMKQIAEASPDIIFLSTEPYPFKEKHVEEIKQYMLDVKVIIVDGEMFSWYGSRLLQAPAYIKNIRTMLDLDE